MLAGEGMSRAVEGATRAVMRSAERFVIVLQMMIAEDFACFSQRGLAPRRDLERGRACRATKRNRAPRNCAAAIRAEPRGDEASKIAWTGAQHFAMPTALHADRLAIVARYREDVDWLQHAPIPYQIVDKGGPSSSNPNVGGDATAVPLVDPRQLPFAAAAAMDALHARARVPLAPRARYSQLRSMRIDLEATGRGYLSISHVHNGGIIHFTKDLLAELSDEEHNQLRRDLLGLQTPYAGRVKHAPCGQFWVRRDRILARQSAFTSGCLTR